MIKNYILPFVMPIKPDKEKLMQVTSSIVFEMGEVGLFHYNKLTYLFEYFYIKNFGKRFTKELFLKFPHGPVISNYHKQILELRKKDLITVDEKILMQKRTVDDFQYAKVPVRKSSSTQKALIKNEHVYDFLKEIVDKFGNLTVSELEKFVYRTNPLLEFRRKKIFKASSAPYLLTDCIRIRDYDNTITRARRKVIKHMEKYPKINYEQQKKDIEEFAFLEKMRPEY